MKSATLTSIAILLAALPLCGQIAPSRVSVGPDSPARLEVALAYSTVRSDTIPGGCDCFWMQGGKAEFRATFSTKIGLVGEIAGQHARSINSAHTDVSLVSYLIGPRLSWRVHRFTPFAQALIGGVHGFDAIFPNLSNSATVPDAFAMAAGGGMNIGLSRHLALRPFQADYFLTSLPNTSANRQNSLRVGGGIVFKFPSPK
jgi:peptidoglycan-associated lipoprotein